MLGSETILGYSLISWLSAYGYLVLAPLMIIEGPVTGFTAGILISYGVFEPLPVFLIFVFATVISDSIFYFLARYSAPFLMRFEYSRRIIERIYDDRDKPERGWTNILQDHFVKFFALAKIIPTVSISSALAIAAGILHVPPKKIYLGNLIAQPIWSAAILSLGFYFGNTIQDFRYLLNVTGILVTSALIFVILYFVYFHKQVMEKTNFGEVVKGWSSNNVTSI